MTEKMKSPVEAIVQVELAWDMLHEKPCNKVTLSTFIQENWPHLRGMAAAAKTVATFIQALLAVAKNKEVDLTAGPTKRIANKIKATSAGPADPAAAPLTPPRKQQQQEPSEEDVIKACGDIFGANEKWTTATNPKAKKVPSKVTPATVSGSASAAAPASAKGGATQKPWCRWDENVPDKSLVIAEPMDASEWSMAKEGCACLSIETFTENFPYFISDAPKIAFLPENWKIVKRRMAIGYESDDVERWIDQFGICISCLVKDPNMDKLTTKKGIACEVGTVPCLKPISQDDIIESKLEKKNP